MPHTVTVLPEHRVGCVHMSGAVDGPEIIAAAAELAAHPDWTGAFRPVWDLSAVTRLDVRPDHMDAMLDQEARFEAVGAAGDSIVITRDDLTAELVFLLRAHARTAGRTITSVRTVAEAEALLGVALPC